MNKVIAAIMFYLTICFAIGVTLGLVEYVAEVVKLMMKVYFL